MRAGIPPRPTAMKILRGEQPKRINYNEPQAPDADDAPPDHLDDVAQEKWAELLPVLKTMRVFSAADRDALAQYCCLYSRWMWAKGQIMVQGEVFRMANGYMQQNPYMTVERDCMRMMLNLAQEFGMTPSSRSRLVAPAKPQDSLSEFLASKPKPRKTGA